jgi:hypothetical protein
MGVSEDMKCVDRIQNEVLCLFLSPGFSSKFPGLRMLALTSLTSGCRSVDIVRSRTQATEFSSVHYVAYLSLCQS